MSENKDSKINSLDFFLFDEEDRDSLLSFKWSINSQGYVTSSLNRYPILVHRFILGLNYKDGNIVDHINGNKLDNRKINLRLCNNFENLRNQKKHKDGVMKYKGIYKTKSGRFASQIWHDNRKIHLGCYDTEEEAGLAYNYAAKKFFNLFANINKVLE
jgi:hypothetical protein